MEQRDLLGTIFSWIFALLAIGSAIYIAHQIAKLPKEPVIATPAAMFSNFVFAMGFGLGLPLPGLTSWIVLGLIGYLGYRLGRWVWMLLNGSRKV